MPLMYDPKEVPYATEVDTESLTEQEHKDSCDINIMLRNAARGFNIRMSSSQPIYGSDDMTLDTLQHRINIEKAEADLQHVADNVEFTPEEFNMIPEVVKRKFKFKVKKKQQSESAKNDDQTTTNAKTEVAVQKQPEQKQSSPQDSSQS